MPKSTFNGVRLQLIGDVSVTVSYPEIKSLDDFMKMKELTDGFVNPQLDLKENKSPPKP